MPDQVPNSPPATPSPQPEEEDVWADTGSGKIPGSSGAPAQPQPPVTSQPSPASSSPQTASTPVPTLPSAPSTPSNPAAQTATGREAVNPLTGQPIHQTKAPTAVKRSLGIKLPRVSAWLPLVGLLLILVAGIGYFFLWRGTYTVTALPHGASITVAETSGLDRVAGTTRPGTYPVSAQATGYIPFSGEITVARGQAATLDIELKPSPKPVKLSEKRVQFMELDPNRESLLYLEPAAKTVFRLFLTSLETPPIDIITPPSFDNITAFLWSPDRQLAFYREGSKLRQYDFNRYDLVNQTVTDWPDEIKSIAWRPDGERVAYFYKNEGTGERTLIRATKKNEEPERIFNFSGSAIENPVLRWSPDGKTIALVDDHLFFFDVFTHELREVPTEQSVIDVEWSPQSDRVVFAAKNGSLGLAALDETVSPLDLASALGRLAFVADGTRLIAVTGSGKGTELVSYTLASNERQSLAISTEANLSPDNLLLGANDASLFFTSAGQPYVLELDTGSN